MSDDRQGLPNIIHIMADDMGWGDVGCYNPDSRIPTPHMDRLAREGIRFTDAHSPSAVCTPTRYGVLTGRFCWRSHLRSNVLYGYEPPLIEPSRRTVARLLQDAGYHTAAIGKWHLGLGYSTKPGCYFDFNRVLPWSNATRAMEELVDFTQPVLGGPTALGFDHFFGASGCPTCQPPYGFIENEHFTRIPSEYHATPVFTSRPGMMAPGWEHKEADPEFARQAVRYIRERADQAAPFFLYLNADAPHEPCTRADVPEFARDQSGAGPRGDLVWLFDWMVGQVLETLDDLNLIDNTLIMVTSDNGALPGDRQPGHAGGEMAAYATYGHKSSADWRGYKAHIWEGGHREPLIARWPGRIPADTVSDALVSLVDFMATCADITGQELDPTCAEDSVSLLPVLERPEASVRSDLIHHSQTGVFALRSENWKAIFETQGSGGWAPPGDGAPIPLAPGQLYDLSEDPFERRNLWEERADVVAELSTRMVGYRHAGRTVAR